MRNWILRLSPCPLWGFFSIHWMRTLGHHVTTFNGTYSWFGGNAFILSLTSIPNPLYVICLTFCQLFHLLSQSTLTIWSYYINISLSCEMLVSSEFILAVKHLLLVPIFLRSKHDWLDWLDFSVLEIIFPRSWYDSFLWISYFQSSLICRITNSTMFFLFGLIHTVMSPTQ